jgi:hypothetical protein
METQNYKMVCPECLIEKCEEKCEVYKDAQTLSISLKRLDLDDQLKLLNKLNDSYALRMKRCELEELSRLDGLAKYRKN